jgi:hypothetical protein
MENLPNVELWNTHIKLTGKEKEKDVAHTNELSQHWNGMIEKKHKEPSQDTLFLADSKQYLQNTGQAC